jgi:hypothetical protein
MPRRTCEAASHEPELRAESRQFTPLVSAIVGEAMMARFSGILPGIAGLAQEKKSG